MSFLRKISRRKFIYGATCSMCGSLILPSCAEVPLTQRRQFNFYKYNMPIVLSSGGMFGLPKIYANEDHLNKEIEKIYKNYIAKCKEKNILIENTEESKKINDIGIEISQSIEAFYRKQNEPNPVYNFNWEYNLIDEKDQEGNTIKNAWCMPGGKIAFFTGIMSIAKNDNGIASIMGHEIAHAFARHTIEKLTQSSILQWSTIALGGSQFSKILSENKQVYNDLVTFGIMLPFSRTMESEADYMGLAFMNLSGFDMQESIKVWERMQSSNKGERPPEFMSSHPSPENRINKLKEWIPEVKESYPSVII